MNFWQDFINLKTAIGGNREQVGYEESFGMPMEENASGGWKTYAIIGGCALAAVIAAVVVSKKRKAARLLAELEEDNNEDI